ncbi:MAG TPA: phosphomannomutase/phosphoglucomutase [Lysobacter sp.]|nr:phosphomannomutase/phosphoglucomutase [Lysobacter sp.]
MSEADNGQQPRIGAAQLARVAPLLAGVLVLLAAWFGWSAWQQFRDDARRTALVEARDRAVQGAQAALDAERKRLDNRLARPDVQAALATGDFAAAGRLLGEGWPQLREAAVVPADLDAEYAALAQSRAPGRYGRLMVLEAALTENASAVGVVRGSGGGDLALAAPARADGQLVAVAFVRLPLALLTAGLEQADVADHSYLALRQGSHSVVERGDRELANAAEVLATTIPGTDLRVAAALPERAGGLLGLDAAASSIAAAVLLLLAYVAWRLPRRLARAGAPEEEHAPEPTLAEQAALAPVPHTAPVPVAAAPMPTTSAESAVAEPAARPAAYDIDRGIFRAYDIRGIVGQSLDANVALLIGQAIGTVMHEQGLTDIVVGRDGRLSGPALVDGLISGLRKAGRNVIDIGMAPTPVVYFGAYHLRAGSCVAVTGSHNPPDYNGFKVVVGSETLSGDAIVDLYERIAGGRLHEADTLGSLGQRDISEDYVQRIAGDIQLERPLKVVVDAGNGVAGDIGPRVLRAIGAEVVPLYCEIDGTFPNHHPDPSEPENLHDLARMVDTLDADLGIAFDGDGDRLGVVSRQGVNIFPDRLLMLFAADVLERNPGAQIIFDVKCTGRLPGYILRHGGSPLMWKTGHSLIKAKMRETEAELAGEMSGHFFFRERWYGFDDGIYAAARLLEILAARPQTPSETLATLPDGISTPEIKVPAPNGDPHAFVERFRQAARFDGARVSTIDGLRVDFPDGWGLVRASNTTPVLVLRFDADSAQTLARIQADFRTQLRALQPDLELPF